MFLHIDNARPHLVDEHIKSIGMTRLQHPPYSPDIAPCDFFLFGFLKFHLEGKVFKSDKELLQETETILKDISTETLHHVFDDGFLGWKNVMNGGEYI